MKKSSNPPLSDLENKVMGVIWKRQDVTAEMVREELPADPPLKDSTVRTILRRLEEKGYVQHRSAGRAYVYSPKVASQSVAADAVRSIIERFCNGSVEALLMGLVDREVVSPEKLQQLALKIAEQEEAAATPPGKSKSSPKSKRRQEG